MQFMNIHILLERKVKESCVEFSNAEKRFGQFEKKKKFEALWLMKSLLKTLFW